MPYTHRAPPRSKVVGHCAETPDRIFAIGRFENERAARTARFGGRVAEENRSWGYDRIVGALANLGHEGSSGDSRVTVFLRCNYKLLIINAGLVCSPSLDPGAPHSGLARLMSQINCRNVASRSPIYETVRRRPAKGSRKGPRAINRVITRSERVAYAGVDRRWGNRGAGLWMIY